MFIEIKVSDNANLFLSLIYIYEIDDIAQMSKIF